MPPTEAPQAMESWITAAINPPPASALFENMRGIQLHQPTGAAVAIKTLNNTME